MHILWNIATLGQLLSMKVVDPILPLKGLNKILSVTLRRGELIETLIASAWLCCGERGLQRNLQEISSKRDLPLMDSGCHWNWFSLLSAQPPHAWAAHQLFTVKCAWKGITKKASGITVGLSPHTYYSKSTKKCEELLSFQPSSRHYFHCRSVVCWFPSACRNIF